MATLYDLADAFQAELLVNDRRAAGALLRVYAEARRSLRAELDAIMRRIGEARLRGEPVDEAWLLRLRRYPRLLAQIEREMALFARHAEATVVAEQREAVALAQRHAAGLVAAALRTPPPGFVAAFDALPTAALTDLVGFLGDGSPLAEVFAAFGPDAAKAARATLLNGLLAGKGPRAIAEELGRALDGQAVRALAIARTETLRAYRESSRRAYRANPAVRGWIWWSARTGRTCAMCWALHGSQHTLDERFGSHVGCRCVMAPATKSWAELGYPGIAESHRLPVSGEREFARLDAAAQRRILGPGKYAAYKAGEVALADLVEYRDDPRWGPVRTERSLRAVRAGGG